MTIEQQLRDDDDEMAQLKAQLDTLSHSLSHDLRTPAMTIAGFTDLLAADLPASLLAGPAGQYLEHIRSSATRQIQLLDKLLELAQLARQPLQLTDVAISELWHTSWHTFPAEVRQRVQLQVAATPAVRADSTLVALLLQRLLDNAVKFSRNHAAPQIHCSSHDLDGVTWYAITDNGIGFEPALAGRLFQPFRRLHSDKQYDGVGMGLAIAACVVRRHRGVIEAHSTPRQGTTVRFTLSP